MLKIILPLYVLTTVAALVVVKLGTSAGLPITYVNHKLSFNFSFLTILALILYGLSFATYIYLISKYDLSYILPLALAFVYILIFVASFFIFHEVFTLTKVVGIVLILGGLVLLNLKR